MPRTISWWALKRHKSDQASFLEDAGPMARLGMPTRIAVATSGPILRIAIRLNDSTDDTVRSTLASIGPALDKVDRLIAEGVIGGDQPNAADFQIGGERCAAAERSRTCGMRSSDRPAAELARRLYPWYPGQRPARPSRPSGSSRCALPPQSEQALARQDFAGPRRNRASMYSIEVERTLVRSPPRAVGQSSVIGPVSPAGSAACRSTTVEPPTRIEWNFRGATGVIELEAAPWGTRVRARVKPAAGTGVGAADHALRDRARARAAVRGPRFQSLEARQRAPASAGRIRAAVKPPSDDHRAERTLVKSPPEVWEELASEPGLGRWLDEVEVREAARSEPHRMGRRGARGTIELEPSGWGTRVRAHRRDQAAGLPGIASAWRTTPRSSGGSEELLDHLGASTLDKRARPQLACREWRPCASRSSRPCR